jgi:prefoldin subunit 5
MWKTDGDKYVTTVLRYRDFASKVVIPYIELASSSQANQRVIQENIGKIPKLEEEIHHFENDTSSASQTQVTQLKQQLQSTRAQLQSARDEQGVIERKESDLRLQLEQQQQVIQEQQQAIQKKDAQLQELTDELQRSATQIAQLESRPPSKEDAERIQQLQNRIAQLLANIQSLNGQLDAKDVYYRSQIAELKRGAESQLSDLRTLGERITVIHPPTVPADVRLCIPGSLVNPDKQLLDIGSEYLTWLETGDQPAMNLPIFSYIYPNFSYSSSPVVPMPGDYVGAAATHDTISLSIGPGGLLTHFQGSLKSQTHRGRLTIIPVVLQYQPCRFESGLVAAYLPNQDYYAFLILRASTPRDVVGYLFTRGDPKEQIVVIEFRAQWIGR